MMTFNLSTLIGQIRRKKDDAEVYSKKFVVENKVIRFYYLDILRGLAALSIVLWHWHHFFFNNFLPFGTEQNIDKARFPLYHLLRPLYGQGWRAVEFFFTLSGFIFFWIYSKKISEKRIDFWRYMKMRISRLYPLHLIMLIVVMIEQQFYLLRQGTYFIYKEYSFNAFFTNLTLTNNWVSPHYSFNGPSWSISVEMLLYIVFFGFCFLRLNNLPATLIFIAIGWLLTKTSNHTFAIGIMSFFTGGVAFYTYQFVYKHCRINGIVLFIILTTLGGFSAILIYRYLLKLNLPFYFFELYFFPSVIINFALIETKYGANWITPFAFIGDISYSSYMIHFPLQLAFVLVVGVAGLNQSVFYHPITLLVFYLTLIGLSLLSYNFVEKTFQNQLRRTWIK